MGSADVVDFLERLKAHEPQPRCILAGPDTRDHVELPPELFGILAQAAHTLLDGKMWSLRSMILFLLRNKLLITLEFLVPLWSVL